jgi:hypothetical protein
LLFITLIGSGVTLPVALCGFHTGDPIHLVWAKHFADQFWTGEIYPRWLSGLNSGLGSPTFYFYAPLPYYVTALIYPLFPDAGYAWLPVGLSATVAMVASGLLMYWWLRPLTSWLAAAVGSGLYMVLPYHFSIDYLSRFAFGEYWSFVWMPMVLRSVHARSLVGLAVGYALMVMTHLPSALLLSVLIAAYALFLSLDARATRLPGLVAGGMLLGLGLSAIYLYPALTMQEAASIRVMTVGHGVYSTNFLFGDPGVSPEYTPQLNSYWVEWQRLMRSVTFTTAAIAVLAFLLGFVHGDPNNRKGALFWLAVASISVFVMVPQSRFLWELLPVFQKIQFPWRANIILTLATGVLSAIGVSAFRRPFERSYGAFALLILILVVLSTVGLSTLKQIYWSLSRQPAVPSRFTTKDYDEYRPRWVPAGVFTNARIAELAATVPQAMVLTGTGSVTVSSWSPRLIRFQSRGTSDILVQLKQFYFPGWSVQLDGDAGFVETPRPSEEGLVTVPLPAGEHHVQLSLRPTASERMGQLVSAASVVLALVVSVCSRIGHRHTRHA